MAQGEGKTALHIDVCAENDLEIDDNGQLHSVTYLFVGEEEASTEVRLSFEDIVDNFIEFYRDSTTERAAYQELFAVANEFSRYADRLRDVAGQMEDHSITGDSFDGVFECDYL